MIFDEFKRICEKNKINYSVIGGSMIGAIRHKGFIPWDDDMDVALLRNDYNRFLEACEKDLDKSRFFLQHEDNEKNYAFAFCKILLIGTSCLDDFSAGANVRNAIWLDVFPLDNLSDKNLLAYCTKKVNHLLKNAIWIKGGYGTDDQRKKTSYKVIRFISFPFKLSWLKKTRRRLITAHNNEHTERLFLSDYPNIIFKSDWFSDYRCYIFEDEEVQGIFKYHEYLSSQYGDYMKLPPENERKGHQLHNISYGKYYNE